MSVIDDAVFVEVLAELLTVILCNQPGSSMNWIGGGVAVSVNMRGGVQSRHSDSGRGHRFA
jgi:hypothetical protein